MPEGVIAGGWSFVVTAYSVTVVVLIVYAWSLGWRRGRMHRDRNRLLRTRPTR